MKNIGFFVSFEKSMADTIYEIQRAVERVAASSMDLVQGTAEQTAVNRNLRSNLGYG